MTSCGDDEELRRQLIGLRGQVDEKTRTVEQLQAQVATLQSKKVAVVSPEISATPSVPAASAEELTKARARIAELEQRLAEVPAAPAAAPAIGKLDLETIATHLEEDLAAKAKQLRQLVQRQSPSSRIDEISLKTIEFPPQIVTPFTSAITFTVAEDSAPPMRLMFPVTADLSGSWRLPTPDEIQKAYRAAKDQPASSVASSDADARPQESSRTKSKSSSPAPSPVASSTPGSSAGQTTTTASGARMTQRSDGVFVFDWGDAPAASQTRPAPRPPSTPVRTPTAAAPPPPSAPPAPPSRGGVTAPPPVMPVIGDRVIRFDD